MATFHELRTRRLELLNDLVELEEAIAECGDLAAQAALNDLDEPNDRSDRLPWLQRQHAGVLVLLSETERALLEFDAEDRDE